MSYNSLIPQPNDRIKDSQSAILANFGAIKTLVDINHVTFDDADQGKHKWVTFPSQAAVVPAIGATDAGIFYGTSTETGGTELFIKKGAGTPVQFTGGLLGANGGIRLPSGVILRWGELQNVNGVVTATFAIGGGVPTFSNVFAIQLTPLYPNTSDNDFAVKLIDFSSTQFRCMITKRTTVGLETTPRFVQWFAIGN